MKKVVLYTLSTCPWCMKTKKYFTEHHVPFEYMDYDLADAATQARISEELDASGATGFPFVRIGSEVIEGYQPAEFAKLLGLKDEAA